MWRWLVGLVVVAALIAGGVYFFLNQVPTHQLADAEQRAGDATVGEGGAKFQRDALQVFNSGEKRDAAIYASARQSRAVILAAKGADQPVPDDVVRAVNDGLRKLGSSADHPG